MKKYYNSNVRFDNVEEKYYQKIIKSKSYKDLEIF